MCIIGFGPADYDLWFLLLHYLNFDGSVPVFIPVGTTGILNSLKGDCHHSISCMYCAP